MCVWASVCTCVCVCVCKLTSLRWHQPQTPQRATSQTAHTVTARETRNTLRDTEPVHTTRTHMHREAERQKMWVMVFCIHGEKKHGILATEPIVCHGKSCNQKGGEPPKQMPGLLPPRLIEKPGSHFYILSRGAEKYNLITTPSSCRSISIPFQ